MKSNKNQRSANTNKKKLLVVALLGTLLLVVAWQNLGKSTTSSPSSAVAVTPTVEKSTTPLSGAAALSVLLQRLPPIELQQLMAHNPFRLIAPTEDRSATNHSGYRDATSMGSDAVADGSSPSAATPAGPPVIQVNAILHGGKRPAALIGQRLYHEQDRLEGGWKISAIHKDRVVFERTAER